MPFAAVAAANCINIPLMRQRWVPEGGGDTRAVPLSPPKISHSPWMGNTERHQPPPELSPFQPRCPRRELKLGIPITDENGNRLGESVAAAQKAILQVVVSRIGMAAPAMGECPAPTLHSGALRGVPRSSFPSPLPQLSPP